MASGTADLTPLPPPVQSSAPAQFEQYIEQQLDRTRSQVKLVDFFGSLMTLAAGILGFLLVTAFVDAWLFDLGFAGRALALVVLVGSTAWFTVVRVLPLILRQINPAYAARVIEQSQPSLKNSLINFLLLRSNRSGVHELVFQAVEAQAAADLSHVPVETAVDRSRLIKLGYVLAGVLLVSALYYVVSPKSPLQTVARVFAPWASVSRPARVEIDEVRPGDAEIFHGQTVKVSARISGARSSDFVTIVFSTRDGQLAERSLTMQPAADGLHYEGVLSPGDGGIQQDVSYRVALYDRHYSESQLAAASPVAESERYHITVLPAPTITVNSVQYVYPGYTKRPLPPPQKQGDIEALEGTKVTITASANLPIKSAFIEFDPLPRGESASVGKDESAPARAANVIPLQAEGREARGTFVLELSADRATPKYSSYQLRFITPEGHQNEQPIVHHIAVTRDLAPEVEIVTPKEDKIEVPEDGVQNIEIRAVDPDFSLSKVALRAVSGGSDLLDKPLLAERNSGRGQAVVNYEFKPAEHSLVAGDEVTYWAVAADNRTAPRTGLPEPNTERTRNYHIRITPAANKPDPDAKQPADGEKEPKPGDNAQEKPDKTQTGDKSQNKQPKEGKPADKNQGEKNQNDKNQADKTQGDSGNEKSNDKNEAGEKGGANSQEKSVEGNNGGSKSGDKAGEKPGEKSGDKSGDSAGDPGGDKQGNKPEKQLNESGNKSGGSDSAEQKSEKFSDGTSKGNQKPGDDPSKKPAAANDDQGAAGQNAADSGSKAGKPQAGSKQGEKPSGAGQESDEPAGQEAQGTEASEGGKPGQDNRRTGGQGGQQSQGGTQGASSQSEKREGPLHDGEVIERLNELVKKQQEQQAKGGQQESGDKQNPKDAAEGAKEGSQSQPKSGSQAEKQAGSEAGQGSPSEQGNQQGASSTQGEKKPGQNQAGEKRPGAKPSEVKQPGPSAGEEQQPEKKAGGSSGEGGKPQGPAETKPEGGGSGKKPDQDQAGGEGQNGKSGAGKPSEDKSGSPASQGENQDRNKKPEDKSGGGDKQGDEAKSPSQSKKQSSSKGGEGGDQSSGGKSGGGQGADQAGNDSAGGNSPGDQGSGAAKESGSGQTSKGGGQGQVAEQPTGVSGEQTGEGSGTKEGAGNTPGAGQQGGKKEGQKPAGDQTGKANQQGQQPKQEGSKPGEKPNDAGQGNQPGTSSRPGDSQGKTGSSGGGGGMMNDAKNGPDVPDELPPEEKANLEYARKATDLALEHLRDQKDNPDPELLKKLGMSKEDLAKFLSRWESLKREATKDETKGKRELNEALRSLGLRPSRDKLRGGAGLKDDNKGLLDQGPRSEPPPSYLEQFNAFKRGTARAEK